MARKEDYIAVFDSGVGGISVLRQLVKQMPGEKYLYFGDCANAPYGTRSTEEIRHLVLDVARHLLEKGIKALVVACNTATSAAIDLLRIAYPDLIIVGIEPAIKLAAKQFPGGTIGVMATPVTLREEKFNHLMHTLDNQCTILKLPAPGLPELIEAGKGNDPKADALLWPILSPWKDKLDAVVLGCTHYPFASQAIRRILGNTVVLLDGGEGTARETKRRLQEAGLLLDGPGEMVWESSQPGSDFALRCQQLLTQE